MREKNYEHNIWLFAGLLNIILIVIFSAIPTFFDNTDNTLLNLWISSPVYIGLWILLPVLWLVYLIERRVRTAQWPKRIKINHIAFILLLCMVILTMSGRQSTVIYLAEGSSTTYQKIAAKIGIRSESDTTLLLTQFDKERRGESAESELLYESYVTVIGEGQTNSNVISVNHPLRREGITLYQSGWNIGVNEFKIRFNDIDYDILNQNDVLIMTPDGYSFTFYPVDAYRFGTDDVVRVQYGWQFTTMDGEVVDEGKFITGYIPGELEKYNFEILTEDLTFISIFQAVYAPFQFWLAVSAFLYLAALAYDFWVKKPREARQ